MILCVLIFLFVLLVKNFLAFSCFFLLFGIFLGLVFLYCYELFFVFDFVYDECRHLNLFLVLFMYYFE